ncbi:hypothetical protein BCR43DRAFT_483113 [Syncephalastrum racemosum]|uniref:F-box domain-containing protein n=1 Tax=Syncephalastrum racemosum TaxID=13706 RepID=A0A1X2HW42_SYNRA|nr:hypothetical protein BCR43DRAFT_483113 [Syncephalastrum racemosum]
MTASHPPPGAASWPAPGTPCSNGSNDYGATSAPGISMTARTSFENARDFVPVMPYDVNILIFGQLDYSARVRCTGVCKTWRRFLLGGWKGLSQTIHLQPNDCMGYFSAKIAEWLSTHLTSSDVQHFTFIGVAAYMPELTRILHTANYSFLHTLRLEGTKHIHLLSIHTVYQESSLPHLICICSFCGDL